VNVRNGCARPQHAQAFLVFRDSDTGAEASPEWLTFSFEVDDTSYSSPDRFSVRDCVKLYVHVEIRGHVPKRRSFEGRLHILFSEAEPQSCRLVVRTLG
jgi:hypothetical protein